MKFKPADKTSRRLIGLAGRALLGVLLWLVAMLGPGVFGRVYTEEAPGIAHISPEEPLVVLYAAKVPDTYVADHGWFAIREGGEWERWEVWQRAGGEYGHVRRNLLPERQDVGAGGLRIIAYWKGEQARAFAECITRESPRYRFRGRYLIWPGPNSNTYIAAMLEVCGIEQDLPWSFYGAWAALF